MRPWFREACWKHDLTCTMNVLFSGLLLICTVNACTCPGRECSSLHASSAALHLHATHGAGQTHRGDAYACFQLLDKCGPLLPFWHLGRWRWAGSCTRVSGVMHVVCRNALVGGICRVGAVGMRSGMPAGSFVGHPTEVPVVCPIGPVV